MKYAPRRSSVLAACVGGEGGGYARDGIPTGARIAETAPRFINDDTPNTVQVDALKPTAAAFVDIIQYQDGLWSSDPTPPACRRTGERENLWRWAQPNEARRQWLDLLVNVDAVEGPMSSNRPAPDR